jgi:hypothetical protein
LHSLKSACLLLPAYAAPWQTVALVGTELPWFALGGNGKALASVEAHSHAVLRKG